MNFMSKKVKRRRLEITIDAMTVSELLYALESIKGHVSNSGDGFKRYSINDAHIELSLDTYGEIDYKIELINGKLCYVLKSKINESK